MYEAPSQSFSSSEVATTIATDINNQSTTEKQIGKNFIKISFTNRRFERSTADIADVIVEDTIAQTTGNLVVCTQITS